MVIASLIFFFERSLYQALVTKFEKIRCTYFGPKTFRGCWTLFTYNITLHCVDYFPCYLGCNNKNLSKLAHYHRYSAANPLYIGLYNKLQS